MSKKFFYLEDDQQLALVTMAALSKRGFDVVHFTHLEPAKNYSGMPQCSHALLDLKLEDGHSLSLISDLIGANPKMKIVVFTGYSSIATAVQAIKLGAKNYLAKPASIQQILSAFDNDDDAVEEELESDDGLSLKRLEWEKIQQVLAENNGNISATARQLKMHRRTLQRKLSKKPVSQ